MGINHSGYFLCYRILVLICWKLYFLRTATSLNSFFFLVSKFNAGKIWIIRLVVLCCYLMKYFKAFPEL